VSAFLFDPGNIDRCVPREPWNWPELGDTAMGEGQPSSICRVFATISPRIESGLEIAL
jgi:hypothetical protein